MSKFLKESAVRHETFDWGDIGWQSDGTGARQFVVMDVTLEPGNGHAFHLHPHQEEMIIVKDGRVEQWLEQEREALGPGDAVYVDAGVVHATFTTGSETARLQVIVAPAVENAATGYEVVDVSGDEPWASLRSA